jgi:hypothetical protein
MIIVVVLVVCAVVVVGGGGGATTPHVSICPAITETASVRPRTVTVLSWRKVFTFSCLLETRKNFAVFERDKHDRSGKTLQGPDVLR